MADGRILQGRSSDEIVAASTITEKNRRTKRQAPAGPAKVSAIKQQVKRAGRYSIYIDGKFAFGLSEGALLDQKIYIGQEVSPEQLAAYKDTSKLDKAYSLTLAFVARRLRSEWELHDYFRRKEIDEDSGELILERLRGFGYVSDLNFARSWVDNRRVVKAVSRRRLSQELHQKHVPDEVIRQVLEDDETTDRDTLRQLVEKKRRQSRYQDSTKLMQYLARQGYNYDDIKQVLAGNTDDSEEL